MQKKSFTVGDPTADRLIEELSALCPRPDAALRLREIFTTLVKLGQEHDDLGDFKLINASLKELRKAFQVFKPYRETRKVAVFGSSRTRESDACYEMSCQLAAELVRRNFFIISGAGGGIMEAANSGAGPGNSFGLNIKLPFEQRANSFIQGDSKLIQFKYFFTRKLIFIKESDATVLLPGGFGTLDEGYENLTLLQTGKTLPRPIILLEPDNGNYWQHWFGYVEKELRLPGYISEQDIHLFHITSSVEDAVQRIVDFYKVYHSLRYVREKTVLRFTREIPPRMIQRLNDEYGDLLVSGTIESSPPLPDEIKKKEYLDLARLVFHFNKRSFGRLLEMIRLINHQLA